jgi:hypothetical protein
MEVGIMFVPNTQYIRKLDSDPRNHLVGHPNFPFGFSNWMPFTCCSKKRMAAKSIPVGHMPESNQHLDADRLDTITAQQVPVQEPPNQPKKSPVREPPPEEPDRVPPQKPPPPGGPPVEEPPNEPGKPPVKEPPPKDSEREPPPKPPVRVVLEDV